MQIINYLKYFFYLAYNWNIRIATHIITHEIKGEKKYGINTTGADELTDLEEKGIDIEHATIYMPVSYDLIEEIFIKADVSSFKYLIDIGCGKGRVLCVAAHFGLQKLAGIELSRKFCDAAKLNLARTKQNFPLLEYSIYNNDAFYFEIPDECDCIFMFNPFDDVIMSAVIENIEMSLERAPRKMTIIYVNPLQKHLFIENNYSQIYYQKKLTYLEAAIFTKNPGSSQDSL